MVLDEERGIIAIEDKFIYLTLGETICLNAIIQNKNSGLTKKQLEVALWPYNYYIYHLISRINKKIKDYGEIYKEGKKYKIDLYLSYINRKLGGKR